MTVDSSGLLLYRTEPDRLVLIAHMGGPYWAKKNEAAWTIPKGLHEPGEADRLAVAEREFGEELGSPPPPGPTVELGSFRSGGKHLHVFARQADFDADSIVSNTFEIEWPPRSGRHQAFPEVDRAAWVSLDDARRLLVKGQVRFVDRLADHLAQS